MSTELIMAVDPGLTSGIAAIVFTPKGVECVAFRQAKTKPAEIISEVIACATEAVALLGEGELTLNPVTGTSIRTIVIEDFILPHRVHGPKEAKATLLNIGALMGFASRIGAEIAFVTPPETKAFRMKRVCEATGAPPQVMRKQLHASDAVRVALAHWSKCYRRGTGV